MNFPHSIPHLVHQVWLGPRPVPDHFLPWMGTIERFAPGWEYRLWREAEVQELIDGSLLPDLLMDDSQPVGLRADVARYEILRRQGGVYFDCDFELLRPLDHLLVPGCLHYGDELSGRPGIGFLASPAGFEFWGFLLRRIRRNLSCPCEHWWDVVERTGPVAFASALNAWAGEWDGQPLCDESGQTVAVHYAPADLVAFWQETLYPYWYEDHTFREFSVERYPLARAAHHWGGSWQ